MSEIMGEIGISVLLPVYDGMPLLQESVVSVMKQEGVAFELVVCDDKSTDESFDYLRSLNDPRIKLLQNEHNLGLFPNLNVAMRAAKYDIVHLWSQDDIMLPGCLQKVVAFHEANKDIGFAFCKYLVIDGKGNVTGVNPIGKDIYMTVEGHAITSLVTGSAPGNIANVSLRKSKVEAVGYFDENMKYSGDFDMWCRLTEKSEVGIIQEQLIKLRNHKGQLSKKPSMWIYRLKENWQINQEFLKRISAPKKKFVVRGIKWRVYTQYMGLLIRLVKLGEFRLFKDYLKELNKQSNLPATFFRYLILYLARKLNMYKKLLGVVYYNKL